MNELDKKAWVRKQAIERVIKSPDGRELMAYLGYICLSDLGCPQKDGLDYAFNEGKRSVFLAIAQMAETDISKFVRGMVSEEEEIL